jgi:hypothetical protein
MIVTGVDHNYEDLLPWWLNNVLTHHPNSEIGIWDLGMGPACRGRMEEIYPQVWWSRPTPHNVFAWFNKVKCVIESPEKSVAWLDIDCQILTDISDVFHLVPPDMIGLTRDWVRANWWATGVIVVNDRPKLLETWNERLNRGDGIRGDQEALYDLIGDKPHEQVQELPQDYQWLRISLNKGRDSPTKKIIHWTGPKGKKYIREHLI